MTAFTASRCSKRNLGKVSSFQPKDCTDALIILSLFLRETVVRQVLLRARMAILPACLSVRHDPVRIQGQVR